MKEKNTILLDLGGVVFQSTGISNEKINWQVISHLNNIYGHDLNIGKAIFPLFLSEYNKRTNQQLSGSVFLKSVFDTLRINQQLIDFLRKQYEIVIVSDNYRENIEYISQRYAFSEWSVQQIYSFDFGMVKSDPDFFKKVLDLLDVGPEKLLLIDDSPKKLESARLHGIRGIRFEDNESTIGALPQMDPLK